MCSFSRVIDVKEGEILFNQGDEVFNFYLVLDGLVKLYRQSADGQEKIFELEGPGRIFAEALMFHNHSTYPVSAAAMQKSTIIAINTRKFLQIIKQSMDTSLMVMGDLSKRLHDLIAEIERLSLLNGSARVATYFLDQYLIKGKQFKLDIPKNAIASLLALQPETFSRLLKELCTKQAIEVQDSHIKVIDEQMLRKQAGIL